MCLETISFPGGGRQKRANFGWHVRGLARERGLCLKGRNLQIRITARPTGGPIGFQTSRTEIG